MLKQEFVQNKNYCNYNVCTREP